jgi:hypothetical protein
MKCFYLCDDKGVPLVVLTEEDAALFDTLVWRLAILNPADDDPGTALRWWLGAGDRLPLLERFNLPRSAISPAPHLPYLSAVLDSMGVPTPPAQS